MKKLLLILLLIPGILSAQKDTIPVSQIVSVHNYYRRIVGSPDISWSDTLARYAQDWANKIAETGQIHHSETKYGENIFWSTQKTDWTEVINSWASEQKYYHGGTVTEEGLYKYGHYTQIIWRYTLYVGCGQAKTKGGLYVYVCQYKPAGNYIGESPISTNKK